MVRMWARQYMLHCYMVSDCCVICGMIFSPYIKLYIGFHKFYGLTDGDFAVGNQGCYYFAILAISLETSHIYYVISLAMF
jgi:hypothetical protein